MDLVLDFTSLNMTVEGADGIGHFVFPEIIPKRLASASGSSNTLVVLKQLVFTPK
jgi:hypothetical protein